VLGPEVVDSVAGQLERLQTTFATYEGRLAEAKERWMADEGGRKQLEKCRGDPKKLARVAVPALRFQAEGLKLALVELLPMLDAMGGKAAQRAAKIKPQLDQGRSTDYRRHLDQLMQEMVVAKARAELDPLLAAKVEALPLPPFGGIKQKVLAVVLELAEGTVRKQVHDRVLEVYAALTAKATEGAAVAAEKGTEKEEDEFGFLVSEGGYEKFKSSSGGLDPEAMVNQVLNARMAAMLKESMVEIKDLVEAYKVKGDEAAQRWLKGKAGGQQMLDDAKNKPEELAKIQLPASEIQKRGLEFVIEMMLPRLTALGGKAAERAEAIEAQIGGNIRTLRSTDVRRHMDQMLQEIVVAKAEETVYPMLESKVDDLPLPPFGAGRNR
jgi:hypothetical protein